MYKRHINNTYETRVLTKLLLLLHLQSIKTAFLKVDILLLSLHHHQRATAADHRDRDRYHAEDLLKILRYATIRYPASTMPVDAGMVSTCVDLLKILSYATIRYPASNVKVSRLSACLF
jgi:hypothetical protein